MGYSKSKATLEGRLGLLTELAKGKACHWKTLENQSHRIAYYIRESLFIARLYKEEYPELAEAARRFRIEVVSPTIVQARLAAGNTEVLVLSGEAPPVHGLENAIAVTMSGAQTSQSVIQHILNTQPSNEKYHWPQAFLSEEDLVEVWLWCIRQSPQWLMFEIEGQLTIQRWTRDLDGLSWNPEDIGLEIDDEARSLIEGARAHGALGAAASADSKELRDESPRPDSARGLDTDAHLADRPADGALGSMYRKTGREEVRGPAADSTGLSDAGETLGRSDVSTLGAAADTRQDEVV